MQNGDTAQLARWFCAEDGEDAKKDWYRKGCREHMKESADAYGVVLGGLTFYELEPGEENAGFPPDDRSGTDWVLVVAEAEVVGQKPIVARKTFVQDLEFKDLQTLRSITRTAYARYNPASNLFLSDEACDEIIEGLSHDVIEKMIVDSYHATKH